MIRPNYSNVWEDISMCIYCNTTNYRKIYQQHYGKIPRDSYGRTYEIHHIDGNRSNNNPDNLVALSIQEHFNTHYSQKDWHACHRIAVKMKLSPKEISNIASMLANERVINGTHNFLGGVVQSNTAKKLLANGTHNFQTDNPVYKQLANGTHNLSGPDNPTHKRIANGTHHFLTPWKCEHCDKEGKGPSYKLWHGDKCKFKNIQPY